PNNFGCANATTTGGKSTGSIGKIIFESGTVNLSSLAPAPVGTGYTWIATSIPCCRNQNNNTSNCNNGGQNLVLRITMHQYVDATGTALTPAQICDNSPSFLEDTAAVTIAN